MQGFYFEMILQSLIWILHKRFEHTHLFGCAIFSDLPRFQASSLDNLNSKSKRLLTVIKNFLVLLFVKSLTSFDIFLEKIRKNSMVVVNVFFTILKTNVCVVVGKFEGFVHVIMKTTLRKHSNYFESSNAHIS